MRLRSLLYVPADSERFITKAQSCEADAVILDLEDAVDPDQKETARENLAKSIAKVGEAGAKIFVRINSDPALMESDVRAAHEGKAFGLYVAKANVESLSAVNNLLDGLEGKDARSTINLIPLIEDPATVLQASELAKQKRVMGLAVGGEDLATLMGAQPADDVLSLPKQLVHLSAKANGLLSLGMFRSVADYRDLEQIARAAREAKRFGFDGASCIHPSAVPILNSSFVPTTQEIAWAERVVSAAAGNDAVFEVDGKMVDKPILNRALQILSTAE